MRMIPVLLLLAALGARAEEPPVLPAKVAETLADFSRYPERNVTFNVEDDLNTAYAATYDLLMDLDYTPAAQEVKLPELIGPLLAKPQAHKRLLAEAVMARLKPAANGTEIIMRGLYVAPDRNFVIDQTRRMPSPAVANFGALYAAKKELIKRTGQARIPALLAQQQENLAQENNLKETLNILQLIERATTPQCAAGRQTRELLPAVQAKINQQEKLGQQIQALHDKIREASKNRDWLTAHRKADELLHVLLMNQVSRDDDRFVEAEALREKMRRALAGQGALPVSDIKLAPAEDNDIAVGFTVVNASINPITSFKVTISTIDAAGKPSAGRIGASHPFTIEPPAPLQPNQYFQITVRLRFEAPAQAAKAQLRITAISWGKKKK